MSDEEYEYESGEEAYEYGSEEEEGEEDNDDEIEIENAFYEGDDSRVSDPAKALEMFEKVVTLETSLGDEIKWRFKALKHLVTIQYNLGNHEEMVKRYNELLQYISNSAVTRNECTDSINSILEAVSAGATAKELPFLCQMYEITLNALKTANNERLWFNTYVKYGKAYLSMGDYGQVNRIVRELHKSCQLSNGSDDPTKGTYLLEVYALEIQLCTATKNNSRMKAIYPKTLNLNAAVADPRIMGGIREEGGKMYMGEQKWNEAYNEFYEGFRGYQEAGNPRAKDALKYVVLANMLALSDINPFAAQEAIAFKEEKEIVAMNSLRSAYEANDLVSFERTLLDKSSRILSDPFIMMYVEPLRRRMREQVLLVLVQPYHRIRIEFVAKELKLEVSEVEHLLVDMILDKRVFGKIDQINGFLLLGGEANSVVEKKYDALEKWTDTLSSLNKNLGARVTL